MACVVRSWKRARGNDGTAFQLSTADSKKKLDSVARRGWVQRVETQSARFEAERAARKCATVFQQVLKVKFPRRWTVRFAERGRM